MSRLQKALKSFLSIIFLSAISACLLVSVCQAENMILIADSAKIETLSKVVARLKSEALAAQQKKTNKAAPLNAEYAEALEFSLSDLRAALPQVIESIAKAKGADVVIEPDIAVKYALVGENISAEAARALDVRSAKLKFLAP